ncbi:FKBP-type peptidyl-prolyl cis-trans isomerase [Gammaproteobacteria bacterium AH-315-C21]|nr:FKBP-type peptidyl-prolyl cis-trans isomerase [Gammaproteobacteria bacterium AH-315-C21]
MNRALSALTVSLCLLPTLALQASDIELKTEKDKLSYAIGLITAQQWKQQNIAVNPDVVAAVIDQIQSGKDPQLSEEEVRTALDHFQNQQQEKAKLASDDNKAEGIAFLANNKDNDGITETESGLQYQIIEPGEGANPSATDSVTVHYKGTLLDGTEFDSSHKRGQPATFPLNGVIAGWTEGVQLVKPGGTIKLFIPSDLAYGDRGSPPTIGPGATLIFDVELISIN